MYNIRWLTSIASYDKLRILRIYFDPNPHGKNFPDGKVCTIYMVAHITWIKFLKSEQNVLIMKDNLVFTAENVINLSKKQKILIK